MEYNDDQVVVANNYSPFGSKIDYIIKAGTLAVIMENRSEPTIHFKTSLNYFNALHNEINELMTDSLRNPELDAQRKRRICSGLRFLAAAVRRIRDQNEITSEMVHPTEMVFDILLKFKDIPLPPIELLAQCMEVCAALVPLFEKEIYNRVINLNILPFISNDLLSFREYSNGVSFDTGAVGYYLVSFERSVGKFDLLLAYLTFLRTFSKVKTFFSCKSKKDRKIKIFLCFSICSQHPTTLCHWNCRVWCFYYVKYFHTFIRGDLNTKLIVIK